MAIQTVIFDLDGTITRPYFDFDVIRKEMGLPEDGGPILEAMEKMHDQDRRRAGQILQWHEQEAIDASELNPGALETLTALHRARIPVGVLTRNLRENALAVARKHGLCFDLVVGREEGPVKPDAFGVLRICRHFGVQSSDALVVGDYLFDILCAKAAGAVAVLLRVSINAGRFADQADYTIENLCEVLQIIEERNRPLTDSIRIL